MKGRITQKYITDIFKKEMGKVQGAAKKRLKENMEYVIDRLS